VKRYVGEPNFAELHQLIEKLLAESEVSGGAGDQKRLGRCWMPGFRLRGMTKWAYWLR
jgi:hypothetical protein